MHWLYDLPTWLLCALIMGTAIFFSLAGVYVVRRRGWMLNAEDAATAGFAHAFVGVLYAVALGLIVVGVQSGYDVVDAVAVKEASLASDLYRDLEGLPEPERSELQSLTRRYVDAVLEKEWPAGARGEQSEETWALMDSIARRIITYEPATAHGQRVFPEVLRRVNELLDQRRSRLFLGASGVSTVTWAVVLIGALIVFGVAWFFNTPSARAHYALVGAMAAMFGLMIFLIVALDHPLWGKFSVQPDAFRAVKANIVRWERERPPAR